MTREELLEELKRVCAAFDRQALDTITERRQSRQEKENMQRELDASRLDNAALKSDNAALKSDNDRLQKSVDTKDAEIKALKARLADTRHSEESLKQEKFAGKNK